MVMLGKNSSRRASSRSARLSSSISHTVSTPRQRPAAKVYRHIPPKPIKSKTRRASRRLHLERPKLSGSERSLLGIIVTSCLCIAGAFIVVATFDPARDAENAMSALAADYYVEFLYPRTLGTQINDPAPILSKYTESGLPSVRLSHLLLYNDGAHANYADYFDNKYYKCDVGHSFFSFYPVAPYGPLDYTVEYAPDCKKTLE